MVPLHDSTNWAAPEPDSATSADFVVLRCSPGADSSSSYVRPEFAAFRHMIGTSLATTQQHSSGPRVKVTNTEEGCPNWTAPARVQVRHTDYHRHTRQVRRSLELRHCLALDPCRWCRNYRCISAQHLTHDNCSSALWSRSDSQFCKTFFAKRLVIFAAWLFHKEFVKLSGLLRAVQFLIGQTAD